MAARLSSSGRSVSAKRSVSPSFRKEDRNLSVRFAEPDRVVRKTVRNVSSRGHVLLPSKGTRPKTCGPAVPHVPKIVVSDLVEPNRPLTSGNKLRRPSMTRGMNSNLVSHTGIRVDTPTPELSFELADDNRFDSRRALHLPPMRNRARSVPNVVDVAIPEDTLTAEEEKAAQNSLSPIDPKGGRPAQRRGSINISTDRLLRDLAHGIQHAELQEEAPEPRWSAKQQNDWDQLRSCRYLRFSKRYENEMDKEVDPFSS